MIIHFVQPLCITILGHKRRYGAILCEGRRAISTEGITRLPDQVTCEECKEVLSQKDIPSKEDEPSWPFNHYLRKQRGD